MSIICGELYHTTYYYNTACGYCRTIVDGEGSLTVFNGHEPMVDKLYTRANRMMAGNVHGFTLESARRVP